MKTTPESLKDLYVAFGNSASDVAGLNTTVDVLNAIADKYEGASDAVIIPDAIDNISAVADNIVGVHPTGKKTITSTAEVDVTNYASAQVVDANLNAGNIKKDISILGITGSYEGGTSDFSIAEVTFINSSNSASDPDNKIACYLPYIHENAIYSDGSTPTLIGSDNVVLQIPIYKGSAVYVECVTNFNDQFAAVCTGDISFDLATATLTVAGSGTITLEGGMK